MIRIECQQWLYARLTQYWETSRGDFARAGQTCRNACWSAEQSEAKYVASAAAVRDGRARWVVRKCDTSDVLNIADVHLAVETPVLNQK